MPSNSPFQFSRRKFFQGGVALAAVGHSRLTSTHSKFRLSSGTDWIKIHRDDAIAFELRAEWFAGSASVWGQQSGNQIAFGVENSRHFGLDLPADATYELWESPFGTETQIRYPGLGLKFSGYAEDWLSEVGIHAFLPSPVSLLDSKGIRVAAAPGPVRLTADGALHFSGDTTAQVHGYGISILSRNAHLRHPSSQSLKANPERKTTVTLHRGAEPWHFELPRGNWNYVGADYIFASALIEASEQGATPTHSILFSAPNAEKSFRIAAEKMPTGTDGRPIDLTLVEPRYAIDLSRKSHKFEAQLAETQSMQFGPLRLLLSPPDTKPALQAGDHGCCVIAQAGFVGTIDTALIAPTTHPEPWDVVLLTDENKAASYAKASVDMPEQVQY